MAARLGSKVEVFKTGCQMCHGGCGIIVHVENERRQIIIAKEVTNGYSQYVGLVCM